MPSPAIPRSPLRPSAGSGELEARYRAYCRAQAAALLPLLPREAIRPLHRAALAWASESGRPHDPREPMETLVAYCRRLLPLPPFAEWLEDVRQNPVAHARAASAVGGPGSAAPSPVTLAARTVEWNGDAWDAGLRVFRDGDVWRGYIAFRGPSPGDRARTADVFREDAPRGVRKRFLELAPATLRAFLRSSFH